VVHSKAQSKFKYKQQRFLLMTLFDKSLTNCDKLFEPLKASGDIPQPRFGHTTTVVNRSKVILFGGATGDTGKYCMSGDTYILSLPKNSWTKLPTQGTAPSPRAAHAATAVESLQVVIYGGAAGGTSFKNCRGKFGFR
jgi:hypothetical protein